MTSDTGLARALPARFDVLYSPTMPFTHPLRLEEALAVLDECPEATILAGGTDLMVEINEGRTRPADLVVAVDRVA